MKPVSPVLPGHEAQETKFVGPGHNDLPVIMDREGGATSRWLLTPEEVEQVARQGYIYVHQIGAQDGVQPIHIGVDPPITFDVEEHRDPVLESDVIHL